MLYTRIVMAGIFISSLSIPLFLLARAKTNRQIQEFAYDESKRYFESALNASLQRSEQMTRGCAESFSDNIAKGEKTDHALILAVDKIIGTSP